MFDRSGGNSRMVRNTAVLVAIVAIVVPAHAESSLPGEVGYSWATQPEFWVATAANLTGTALFIARVYAPSLAPGIGLATQLIGLPAVSVGLTDITRGRADAATIGVLAYGAWAVAAAVVDHVLCIDYRDPPRWTILGPYVALYYAGIGIASATQLVNGKTPWVIAGATCVVTVAASFYARALGAD